MHLQWEISYDKGFPKTVSSLAKKHQSDVKSCSSITHLPVDSSMDLSKGPLKPIHLTGKGNLKNNAH